jgi:hypothetical protein
MSSGLVDMWKEMVNVGLNEIKLGLEMIRGAKKRGGQ